LSVCNFYAKIPCGITIYGDFPMINVLADDKNVVYTLSITVEGKQFHFKKFEAQYSLLSNQLFLKSVLLSFGDNFIILSKETTGDFMDRQTTYKFVTSPSLDSQKFDNINSYQLEQIFEEAKFILSKRMETVQSQSIQYETERG
jgi:hypothetical protein